MFPHHLPAIAVTADELESVMSPACWAERRMKSVVRLAPLAQRGLTLVELMVALALSLLLLAGTIQIFISSKQSYRVQDALSRLQENSRAAVDLLSRDIRAAALPRLPEHRPQGHERTAQPHDRLRAEFRQPCRRVRGYQRYSLEPDARFEYRFSLAGERHSDRARESRASARCHCADGKRNRPHPDRRRSARRRSRPATSL